MARQHANTRVATGRTLIRRYALALTPTGAGIEAAVTAASGAPLSSGPDSHGSEAAHPFTIADSVGGVGRPAPVPREDCADRTLILGEAHLRAVLTDYQAPT